MTTGSDWLDRVLGADDLPEGERRALESLLATRPDARALLERVRAVERGEAGPRGQLPPLDSAELVVPPPARAAAEASRAALLARALPHRPGWFARLRARLRARLAPPGASPWPRLVPVAAAALLLVVVLRDGAEPERGPWLGDAMVVPAERVRGGDEAGAPGDRTWRTGDAFVLRCPVERAMAPVLFHVDPHGAVALLHPIGPEAPWPLLEAGTTLELPPPDADIEWVLEGEGGAETFVLAAAAADRPRPDLETLEAQARLVGTSSGDRGEAVRRLRALLEREVGEVRVTEIRHAP